MHNKIAPDDIVDKKIAARAIIITELSGHGLRLNLYNQCNFSSKNSPPAYSPEELDHYLVDNHYARLPQSRLTQ